MSTRKRVRLDQILSVAEITYTAGGEQHTIKQPLFGLDDGPPLPSPAALERAAKRIMAAQPKTDAERINWLESMKYGQFGIGYDGHHYQVEVRVGKNCYFGRSLRGAIDSAMKGGARDPKN